MSYAFVQSDRFLGCIRDFQQRDPRYLAELWETVIELGRQPFGNPILQTHRMQGVSGEKRFITDVGGRKGRRLIWSQFNRTFVLLLFGEHDVVERQGERLELIEDPETGGIEIVERTVVDGGIGSTARAAPPVAEPGQLFMGWTNAELAGFGFLDHEVPVLRRLDHEDELLELTMRDEAMELAVNLVAYQNPEGKAADQVPATRQREFQERTRAVVDDEARELERKVASPRSRKHFAPTTVEALKEVMSKPIEDWMIFLHPDQAKLTQRPFSGPARVRGAAGTGKTVVALHRAKHLAETYGEKVLFTTYVNNLPKVFDQLFRRLAPELAGQVDFVNLHAWAYRFVKANGSPFQVDPQQAYSAYSEAYKRTAGTDPDLDGLGWAYLREELDWVIKGRALTELADYLALPRTGRGTPLPARVREHVWALYEEYERQLDRRRIVDFNDLLTRALELLQDGRASSPYRSVVIDEAQDLTETGLRLAYELAGRDERDGLFMVGDGQQSVYPGGFSLSHLGIDVRGRSSLLKVNYRNTRAILEAARTVIGERPFDDAEDELDRRDVGQAVTVVRDGTDPTFEGFADVDDHDTELVAAIAKVSEDPDVSPGDIAVLVPTNAMVKGYATLIQSLGLRTQKLEQYEGVPNGQVKVGTYQRGKGLEFKHVFLPRLDADGLHEAPRNGEDETAHAERLELIRRQVFVAMTRARDGLWAGWVGGPSSIIDGGTD
jgi:hypothetical protein